MNKIILFQFVVVRGMSIQTIGDILNFVSQSLGIGTINPRSLLDVYGTVTTQSSITSNLTVFGSAVITTSLGIGTTNPRKALDIEGDINIGGTIYQNNSIYVSSQWSSNNNGSLYYLNSVGIGSTQPRNALDVNGTISGTNLTINNTITTSNLTVLGTQTIINTYTSYTSNLTIDNQLGSGPALLVLQKGIGNQYPIADFYDRDVSTTIPALRLADGGNVGIGTTLPQQQLHIQGNVYTSSSIGIGSTQPVAPLDVNGNIRGSGLTGTLITDNTSTTSSTIAASATAVKSAYDTAVARVLKAGDTMTGNLIVSASIGIGSTQPTGSLDVSGNAFATSIGIGTRTATHTLRIQGNTYASGSIGIGSTQPVAPLDVSGNIFATNIGIGTKTALFPLHIQGNAIINGSSIGLGTTTILAPIHLQGLSYHSTSVGIGSTNPLQQLHVQGNIYTSGSIGIGSTRPVALLDVDGSAFINSVGIGTHTALFPLHVQGNAYASGSLGIGTTIVKRTLDVQGDINFAGSLYQNNSLYISSQWTSNIATNSLYYNGSVGIGSTQPINALDVNGSISGTNLTIINNIITSNITVLGTQTIFNTSTASNLVIDNISSLGPALKVLQKGDGPNYPIADFYDRDVSTTIPAFRIADRGSIGIGTATPLQQLHLQGQAYISSSVGIGTTISKKTLDVQGDINFSGSLYQNNSLYISTSSQWTSNNSANSLYYNGSVGIGTTNPTHKLHVYSTSTTNNDYESAGILLENATTGEAGIAFRNANIGTNAWVMGLNSNSTRLDIAYGVQTSQLNLNDVKLSLDTAGTLTTSNLVVLGQVALAPGALNTNIQVKPTRQTFYVSGSTQSAFTVLVNGLYGGEASNIQVYLGQKLLTYYTATYKDYDVSLDYPSGSITQYTITLTTPAVYGDFVDITVWPQLLPTSVSSGSVYQNITFSNLPTYVTNNYSTLFNQGSVGNIYTSSNVGIGTTVPKKTLDVQGDINFAGSLYQNNSLYISSQWTSNNTTNSLYYSGSVGIGSTQPINALDVNGTIVGKGLLIDDRGGNGSVGIYPNGSIEIYNSGNPFIDFKNAPADDYDMRIGLTNGTDFYLKTGGTTNIIDAMRVTGQGSVGIGTTVPLRTLDVNGLFQSANYKANHWLLGFYTGGSTARYIKIATSLAGTSGSLGGELIITGNVGGWDTTATATFDISIGLRSGTLTTTIKGNVNAYNINTVIGYADFALYRESDNSYSIYLKVIGYYNVNFFIYGASGYTLINPNTTYIDSPTGTLINNSILTSLSQTISGNNLGIGTALPTHKLHIYSASVTDNDYESTSILLDNATAGETAIAFRNSNVNAGGNVWFMGLNSNSTRFDIGYGPQTTQLADYSVALSINTNCNIGIGTKNPQTKLHIQGDNSILIGPGSSPLAPAATSYSTYYGSGGITFYYGTTKRGSISWLETSQDIELYANVTTRNLHSATNYGFYGLAIGDYYINANGMQLKSGTFASPSDTTPPYYNLKSAGGNTWSIQGPYDGTPGSNLYFNFNTLTQLTLQGAGGRNVGIGTTNPTHKLHIYSTSSNDNDYESTSILLDNVTAGETAIAFRNSNVNAGGNVWFMGLNSNSTRFDIGYGTQSSQLDDASVDMSIDTTGNVGIGTIIPQAKVHIAKVDIGDIFRIDDEVSETTPFIVKDDGNIGIGRTNPQRKLEISAIPYANGANNGLRLSTFNSTVGTNGYQYSDISLKIQNSVSRLGIEVQSDSTYPVLLKEVISIPLQFGSIGIGTTQPRNALDVNGTISGTNLTINNTITTSNLTVLGTQTIINTYTSYASNLRIDNQLGDGPALVVLQKGVGNQYAVADFYDRDVSTTIPALRIAEGANIGIGTATPQQQLHVQGNAYASGSIGIGSGTPVAALDITGTALISSSVGIGTKTALFPLHVQGDAIINGSSIGVGTTTILAPIHLQGLSYHSTSVGIGSTNPLQQLHVQGNAYASGRIGIGTTNPVIALDVTGGVRLKGNNSTTYTFGVNGMIVPGDKGIWFDYDTTNNYGKIQVEQQGSAYRNLSVNLAGGNVGIGISNPLYKLHVLDNQIIRNETYNGNSELYIYGSNNGIGILTVEGTQTGNTAIPSRIIIYKPNSYLAGGTYIRNRVSQTTEQWFAGVPFNLSGPPNAYQIGYSSQNGQDPCYDTYSLLTIKNTGSIGIGTTNPTHKLHIYSASVTDNNYESTGILLDNATTGEVGIAFRNSNLSQNAWVMGLNSNSTRLDIAYGVQTNQLNINDVKLSLDTAGTLTTSNLVVLGQVALAPGALNTNIQVKPTRQTFYVNTSTQSSFTVLVNGLYGGEASNVQVYLGQKILTYYNSTYKDYTLSLDYPTSTTTQYTISLTTPAVYGNFVDITVWPQLLSTSISSGSVYQNIAFSNLPTYITNNYNNVYSTLFNQGSVGNIYTTSNVGIGLTNPGRLVHIQGNNGVLRIDRDSPSPGVQIHRFPPGDFTTPWKGFVLGVDASSANNGYFYINDFGTGLGGNSTNRFLIDNIGNIGISTTSPTHKLHIYSASTTDNDYESTGILLDNATAGETAIAFRNSNVNAGGNVWFMGLNSNSTRFDIGYGTQSTQLADASVDMCIDTNGNVGIGTTIPLQKLHIGGSIRLSNSSRYYLDGSDNIAYASLYTSAYDMVLENSAAANINVRYNGGTGGYVRFYEISTGTTKFLVNGQGNVGIGTATPLQKLDVYGNATIGNGQSGSASATVGGPFFKQISWDAAGVTHTLTYPVFCIGDNSAGTLHIQVSNKLTTGTRKIGTAQYSFIKCNGVNTDIFENSYHRNINLGTFNVTTSGNDIVVTTDSDCSISWTSIGSY